MLLAEAVEEVVSEGKCAFIPFIILGYPSVKDSEKMVEILKQTGVTAFETAIPVSYGLSEDSNEIIRRAHKVAIQNRVDAEQVIQFFSKLRPNLFVLYKPTIQRSYTQTFVNMKGNVDSILFEWGPKNYHKLERLSERFDISAVPVISAVSTEEQIANLVKNAQSIIYLMVSSKTGGTPYPNHIVSRAILKIRKFTSQPICCAFGIRTPEDIKRLRSIRGCDGIIIGTELLRQMKNGSGSFEKYVKSIINVCQESQKVC